MKEHCGIGRSWAYELLAIGGGTKTEEESRAKNAEANSRCREKVHHEMDSTMTLKLCLKEYGPLTDEELRERLQMNGSTEP